MKWSWLFNYAEKLYYSIPEDIYLGVFFCVFILSLLSFALTGFKKGVELSSRSLLLGYVFLLLCSTVFFRAPTPDLRYNYLLFWSYTSIIEGSNKYLIYEIVLNILVFIPIGILLGIILTKNILKTSFLISLFISLSIELLQLFFHRGYSEVDDIFHNLLGYFIGVVFVIVIKRVGVFIVNYER